MFVRHVEFTLKTEKKDELRNLHTNQILPLLNRQNGFLDTITFVSENKPDKMISITLWKTKNDAENYHRNEFPKITEMLKPYMKGTPIIENYTVEYSTVHKELVAAA